MTVVRGRNTLYSNSDNSRLTEKWLIKKPMKLPTKNPIEAYHTSCATKKIVIDSHIQTTSIETTEILVFVNMGDTTEL